MTRGTRVLVEKTTVRDQSKGDPKKGWKEREGKRRRTQGLINCSKDPKKGVIARVCA